MAMGAMHGLARLDDRHRRQHVLRIRRLAREVAPHLTPVGLLGLGVLEADNARRDGPG